MDDKHALHTAARRYCQERFAQWMQSYRELQIKEKWQVKHLFKPGWDYSNEAYGTFPRYRLDEAIRIEVEKFRPDSNSTLDELRKHLLRACDVAEGRLQAKLQNPIAFGALREEADDYRAYIQVLDSGDLLNIEALPYRRVIDEDESKRLWNQLKDIWGIGGGCWFPLKEGPTPPNVIAFHLDYFEGMDGVSLLREALKAHGAVNIFQLQEFGPSEPEYEIELSIFEPIYGTGGEQYSTSEPTDWVVYVSHESSITFAGDWLIQIVKDNWPDWSHRTYQGPYSTGDLRGTWNSDPKSA
jgi:hypothetical protein